MWPWDKEDQCLPAIVALLSFQLIDWIKEDQQQEENRLIVACGAFTLQQYCNHCQLADIDKEELVFVHVKLLS